MGFAPLYPSYIRLESRASRRRLNFRATHPVQNLISFTIPEDKEHVHFPAPHRSARRRKFHRNPADGAPTEPPIEPPTEPPTKPPISPPTEPPMELRQRAFPAAVEDFASIEYTRPETYHIPPEESPMKLYFYPGACSLAAHIVLREAGFHFDIDQVDLATKKTAGGEDYLAVNPKGYVPALKLDDGQVLTEDQVLLQYLADKKPDSVLAPKAGTMERYRLMEWLAFIATEVHKGFGPFWNPAIPADVKQLAKERLAVRFAFLDEKLGASPYLMGEHYSVADAYLFVILGWADVHKIDLSAWPKLVEYKGRIFARPAVQEAMRAEKLIP